MKRWHKVLLGLITHWPPLYMAGFMGFFFWMMFRLQGQHGPQSGPDTAFLTMMVLHLLTMLIMFGLIAIYLVILFKLPDFPQDRRILWLIVILMFGIFAMPVFFWVHIWKLDEDRPLFGGVQS